MTRRTSGADGALVVDKPAGLSSHDVVAAVRRLLGGARAGHTGTLDPIATGVLPLLVGRATRLARFFASATKRYDARIRFGWATDTYDSAGEALGPPTSVRVDRGTLEPLLERFRGTFAQRPPAFSAKKVEGRRAYALARSDRRVALEPVSVTVHDLQLVDVGDDIAMLDLTCSAGFYVRSLAHDLGVALGTGAHLAALRRTRSGEFTVSSAVPFADIMQGREVALECLIPLGALLGHLPGCRLTEEGLGRVLHGRDVEPRLLEDPPPVGCDGVIRLLDGAGDLVALGVSGASGVLHPAVVLR